MATTKKKTKASTKVKNLPVTEVQIIWEPKCDGDPKPFAIYDPKKKVFLPDMETIHEAFDRVLGGNYRWGSGDFFEQIEKYSVIPEFKTLWDDFLATVDSKLKPGDQIVRYGETKPETYTVMEIIGYNKHCGENGEPYASTNYRIVRDSDGLVKNISDKDQYYPLEEIGNFEAAKKQIFAIKKKLKAEGMLGAIIVYKGRAYRF